MAAAQYINIDLRSITWQLYVVLIQRQKTEAYIELAVLSAYHIKPYLEQLKGMVESEAPAWASKDPSYSFNNSLAYAKEAFPRNCEPKEFLRHLVDFAYDNLTNGNLDKRTCTGWFLAVLANALSTENQADLLIKQALPNIWSRLIKNGSNCIIGEHLNPTFLDILDPALQESFLCQTSALLEENFVAQLKDTGKQMLFRSHSAEGISLGVYNFEDEKDFIIRYFVDSVGSENLVAQMVEPNIFVGKIAFLTDCFRRLQPDQAKLLAGELDRQLGCKYLTEEICLTLKGGYERRVSPHHAMGFLTGFMDHSPQEIRSHYTQLLIADMKEDLLPVIVRYIDNGFNHSLARNFLNALSDPDGQRLVGALVKRVLAADYSGKDRNYGGWDDSYQERSTLAVNLYDAIPLKHRPYAESLAIKFLEASPADESALLKASLLLHKTLQKAGVCKTKEIDFYLVGTWRTLAHIKPDSALGHSGVVTSEHFIGSLDEYYTRATTRLHGAPRDYPPHQRELFPPEIYLDLYPVLQKAEQECLGGTPSSLPSILEVLHERQPKKGLGLSLPLQTRLLAPGQP